jgi:hypothetical protein
MYFTSWNKMNKSVCSFKTQAGYTGRCIRSAVSSAKGTTGGAEIGQRKDNTSLLYRCWHWAGKNVLSASFGNEAPFIAVSV